MTHQYVTSAFLQGQGNQVYTVFGWSAREGELIPFKSWLLVLELFTHEPHKELVYQTCLSLLSQPLTSPIEIKLSLEKSEDLLIYLSQNILTVLQDGFPGFITQRGFLEFISISKNNPQVLQQLFADYDLEDDRLNLKDRSYFDQVFTTLENLGLIVPAPHSLNWGDFKRMTPLCHITGWSRGTPVDRYYLDQFVQEIRHQVIGKVVDIGGLPKDQEIYQFNDCQQYQVMNLEAEEGIDLVGDVHDTSLFEAESYDSIIMFNVLEHCHEPWLAVDNLYRWLKRDGKCFVMVPNAQRLHNRPGDYWRIFPDGMQYLFRKFSQTQLYVYGNPLTVIASLHGIGYEELTPEELNATHIDYPVCSCIVATK